MKERNQIKNELKKVEELFEKTVGENTNKDLFKDCLSLNYASETLAKHIRDYSIQKFSVSSGEQNEFVTQSKSNFINCSFIQNNILKFNFVPLLNYRLIEKKDGKTISKSFNYFNDLAVQNLRNFVVKTEYKINENKKILLIFNIVNSEIPNNKIPDTDNREYQSFVNIIKSLLIPDDSSEYLSLYLDTLKRPVKSCTVAYLVDEKEIIKAIPIIKKDLDSLNKIIKFPGI